MKKTKIYLLISLVVITIFTILMTSLNYLTKREEEILMKEALVHYTAYFNLNGADSIESKKILCAREEKGCYITFPMAYRDDGVVLGYSDRRDDKEVKYQIGETISIENDTVFYVVSYATNTLVINGDNVDFIDNQSVSCNVYNRDDACEVILPLFNKDGYENRGYSSNENATTGFAFPNEKYKLSKNTTLYPIYGTISRGRNINISQSLNVNSSIVEIENGCSSEVYSNYLSYLNNIEKYAPYLLIGSKISFLKDSTFTSIWGSGYVGMNYGTKNLRSLDLRCSNDVFNDYYATMIHEMTHSWDFYYAKKIGTNISSESDIINLYNKYLENDNRPFRDYSYSSIYEFFADMMRYYYFKYIDTSKNVSYNYPSDIKQVMEKYICIAQNNYDRKKCM